MNLINVNNLSKSFRRGERDFFAIDNVSFDVKEKDFINIIGKSGSGKSTLLTLLSAIIEPTSGDILVEGKNLSAMDDEEKSGYRNEFIGYVPQSLGTLPTLNVLDNVRLPYFFKNREGDGVERARMLLDMCGILDLENDFCKNLSGGELKRVLIARALMNEPKILIADEPTSDLDSKTTIEIMNMLKEINEKGTTIIIVTHDNDLLKYGSRLLEMTDGKLNEVAI
ncbi:MAG: ABC transporter ATP-binding protein [Eubacteriales bacterium]|uniref:ABC transporter ATP-binding protein n=1 Tax=Fenollaria sp. TaxID=1965292 RepID=UPI002A75B37A|nr:ABC transporter ATP-binding protein [Fenollaria sp.]MDD7340234.1 ABC transporter ATP-binding protein [Eubacteriales bacterium]MDY3105839.1 ABC transporter ATP-binding protein [Fenollaria sp.]